MKIEGAAIVSLLVLAACPKSKGAAPPAEVNDCEDVGAHAESLYARVTPRRDAVVGRDLFAQGAEEPPAEGAPMPLDDETNAQREGEAWEAECLEDAWTQMQIDCYMAAPTVDDGRACITASPVAAEPGEVEQDPACVAAADQGAITIAKDAGMAGDADLMARARAAILGPCLETRYGDKLLKCVTTTTEHLGMCGYFAEGDDWERMKASLNAAGFSSKQ